MQAQPANVGYAADSACPLTEQAIIDGQGIAAAEDDFVDFRAGAKDINYPLPVRLP